MELIDRYIYAVSSRLPADMRDDVAEELRGTIEEMLDAKKTKTKTAVREVLTELGDPAILAEGYRGSKQYLIGPELYRHYIGALKMTFAIGMPIVTIGWSISKVIDSGSESIIDLAGSFIGIVLAVAMQMIFWVSAVFIIMERTNVKSKDLQYSGEWTPDQLPAMTEKRQISISEIVGDSLWYLFIGALPFLARNFIGTRTDGNFVPFFNPEFIDMWAWAFITLAVLGLIKTVYKYRFHKWTFKLAGTNIAYSLLICSAAIAAPFIGTVVNPEFAQSLSEVTENSTLAQAKDWANWAVGSVIVGLVASYLYDAGKSIWLAQKNR